MRTSMLTFNGRLDEGKRPGVSPQRTNSSALAGWIATVSWKPASVAPMRIAAAKPCARPPNGCSGKLATRLQLASATQRHWRHRTHVQTQLVTGQRVDASHLGHWAARIAVGQARHSSHASTKTAA
jgi:hypothetical protein